MNIYLSLLVCLVGMLLYLLIDVPKPAEVGRIMFWCGLVVFLYCNCGRLLR